LDRGSASLSAGERPDPATNSSKIEETMPKRPPTTTRLEAFSDGVIAVIITIMVLELKVPSQDGMAGLYAILPSLLLYLLSFSFTGIFWMNHHHLLARIELADRLTLYANLGFLFCLSLLPFFTAYLLEKQLTPFAVSLYAYSMLSSGTAFLLLRCAVHRNLRYTGDLRAEDQAALWKHLASLGLYLLAGLVAYFHSLLALVIIAVLTLLWAVPNLAIPKCEQDIAISRELPNP
jgi:uncharacterized membrane protein